MVIICVVERSPVFSRDERGDLFAKKGGYILGICNGFQVLTEAQLLPGSLLANEQLDFVCRHQYIRVETAITLTMA